MTKELSLDPEHQLKNIAQDEAELYKTVQNIENSCLIDELKDIYIRQIVEVYSMTAAVNPTSVEYFVAKQELQDISADFHCEVERRQAVLEVEKQRNVGRSPGLEDIVKEIESMNVR